MCAITTYLLVSFVVPVMLLTCLQCHYSIIIDEEWCNSQSVGISFCGSGHSLRHWPWPGTEMCDSGSKGHGEELSIRRWPLGLSWRESVAVTRLGATAVTLRNVRLISLKWPWLLFQRRRSYDGFSPCLNASYFGVFIYLFFLGSGFSHHLIGNYHKLQWVIGLTNYSALR